MLYGRSPSAFLRISETSTGLLRGSCRRSTGPEPPGQVRPGGHVVRRPQDMDVLRGFNQTLGGVLPDFVARMLEFHRTWELVVYHCENKMQELAPGLCGSFTTDLSRSCEASTRVLQRFYRRPNGDPQPLSKVGMSHWLSQAGVSLRGSGVKNEWAHRSAFIIHYLLPSQFSRCRGAMAAKSWSLVSRVRL